MNYNIIAYSFYLPITIILTMWVARTLFINGKVFLIDIFHGNKELANSVNHLLIVGFYLINIGYAVHALTIVSSLTSYQFVIEVLSKKLGAIILILGGMHFFNLYVFFNLRKRATAQIKEPEVADNNEVQLNS